MLDEEVLENNNYYYQKWCNEIARVKELERTIGYLKQEIAALTPPYVDLVASGYEWVCPSCDELNKEIEWTETMACPTCGTKVMAMPPEHAYS